MMRFIKIMCSLLLLLTAHLLAISFDNHIDVMDLLGAPTIVVGEVNSLTPVGEDILQRGSPIKVDIFDASIEVWEIIKGSNFGKSAFIEGLLRPNNPANYIGRQFLETGKAYVFFLLPLSDEKKFSPINYVEFALEIENMPDSKGESIDQYLRSIAKKSIDNDNEFVAARWFEFLGDLYNDAEDYHFCLDRTKGPRWQIRGSALAILCEHNHFDQSLYSDIMKFLNESSDKEGLWPWRRRICKCLSTSFHEYGLTGNDLKDWLNSNIRELQETALILISEENDISLMQDIKQLMLRTDNKAIQYDCIKTLANLSNRNGPSYKNFMNTPNRYVEEWKNINNATMDSIMPNER